MRPRVLLCLLTLALLKATVAVVVISLAFQPGQRARGTTVINVFGDAANDRGWPLTVPPNWPGVAQWSREEGPHWHRETAWSDTQPVTTHQAAVTSFGWPVPMMRHHAIWCPVADIPPGLDARRLPPIRPIAPAFSAAVALVATVLLVPMLLLSVSLLRARRARGLCIRCGYLAGDALRCTECGQDTRSIWTRGVAIGPGRPA